MSLNETIFQFDDEGFMSFPKEKVEASIFGKKVIDEVYFVKANLTLKDDITVQSKSKVDGILLDFNLIGDVSYKSKIHNYGFSTSKNRTDIELIKEENTESKAKKGEINKISLIVKKDFLAKNLPLNKKSEYVLNALEKNSCQELLKSEATNFLTNKILNQLYHFDMYEGNLGDIFLQSKVLELLYCEFFELFKEETISKNSIVKFDEKDMQALYKAKDLILSFEEDFTITTLSKKVALNEFKLKTGFKKYFNTSPGNLIIEQKMLKAKQLLETGDYNVNQISQLVGYKYQQSFTATFTKYFGVNPKTVIKTKSIFYK
ncbi:helix-turn-helix transcriptional regulator [Aliarcobacter butzleri]|uniref:helix-turn-helix transcriptional regulator n=1 Tax=Aliarcobacter butzleri TaxID=28197 RepID=UPI002B24F920|nr:helix-turn-helix transcriptional regulator [Aliarcobacter butzleri]